MAVQFSRITLSQYRLPPIPEMFGEKLSICYTCLLKNKLGLESVWCLLKDAVKVAVFLPLILRLRYLQLKEVGMFGKEKSSFYYAV
jgi:hypothetical protein